MKKINSPNTDSEWQTQIQVQNFIFSAFIYDDIHQNFIQNHHTKYVIFTLYDPSIELNHTLVITHIKADPNTIGNQYIEIDAPETNTLCQTYESFSTIIKLNNAIN